MASPCTHVISGARARLNEHAVGEVAPGEATWTDLGGQASRENARAAPNIEYPVGWSSPQLAEHGLVDGPVHRELHRRQVVEP